MEIPSSPIQHSPSSKRLVASQQSFTARCFVPETLIDYINSRVREELKPASFFIHGVCLLVDISGFTKLSGAFCALGKDGIDGLQRATNGYMGKLVEIIYSFGGDIIKFAGDAIICIFYSKKRLQTLRAKLGPIDGNPGHNDDSEITHLADKLNAESNSFRLSHDQLPLGKGESGSEKSSPSKNAGRLNSNSEDDNSVQFSSQKLSGLHDLRLKLPVSGKETEDMYLEPSDSVLHVAAPTASEIQPEIVLKAIRCAIALRAVETEKLRRDLLRDSGRLRESLGVLNIWPLLAAIV